MRRFHRPAGDGGFSLTELTVVITLMAVVGGVVATAATTGLKKQTQVQDRTDTLAQERTALQRIGRDIRSAATVQYALDNELILEEVQTSTSWTVDYKLVADGSKYDLTAVRTDKATGNSTTTILLRNVVMTAGKPLFSYLKNPSTTSSVTTTDCSIAGSTPTRHAQDCIGTITVDVQVQPTSLARPIEMVDNGTELRNAP
ncbi:MAG: type II secretion system protein [Frankiaceae bacterium]|nr:type II secretion system protein [Frankiaceae bacterium]MBV9872189.1 type II secretion system protein [Frankiaceae bacterium]